MLPAVALPALTAPLPMLLIAFSAFLASLKTTASAPSRLICTEAFSLAIGLAFLLRRWLENSVAASCKAKSHGILIVMTLCTI